MAVAKEMAICRAGGVMSRVTTRRANAVQVPLASVAQNDRVAHSAVLVNCRESSLTDG